MGKPKRRGHFKGLPRAAKGVISAAALARTASLTPNNSRDDPGYASEWELYGRNQLPFKALTPGQLRLAQLERLQEQGDLTAAEEEDSSVDITALQQQFTQHPVAGLQEVIIIKHQQVIPFIP